MEMFDYEKMIDDLRESGNYHPLVLIVPRHEYDLLAKNYHRTLRLPLLKRIRLKLGIDKYTLCGCAVVRSKGKEIRIMTELEYMQLKK